MATKEESIENRLNKLTMAEKKAVKESLTQTRFTWAVLLLTFVTILIGLLTLTGTSPTEKEVSFLVVLSIAYFAASFAACYSLYGLCRTTYLLHTTTRHKLSKGMQDFLEKDWGVFYASLVSRNGNFDKMRVYVFCLFLEILMVLLFMTRVGLWTGLLEMV
jgi:hypothetical protein